MMRVRRVIGTANQAIDHCLNGRFL